MRARIIETEERSIEFKIDPADYPETVGSWQEALDHDVSTGARPLDGDAESTEIDAALLGDPASEPWPETGGEE